MDPELDEILKKVGLNDEARTAVGAKGITSVQLLAYSVDKPETFREQIGVIAPWQSGDSNYSKLKMAWLQVFNKENRTASEKGLEASINDYEPLPGVTVRSVQALWATKYGSSLPSWIMPTTQVWTVLYRQLQQRRLVMSPATLYHTTATATALPQNPKSVKVAPDVYQTMGDPNAHKPKKMMDRINSMFLYNMSMRNMLYALVLAGVEDRDVERMPYGSETPNSGQMFKTRESNVRKEEVDFHLAQIERFLTKWTTSPYNLPESVVLKQVRSIEEEQRRNWYNAYNESDTKSLSQIMLEHRTQDKLDWRINIAHLKHEDSQHTRRGGDAPPKPGLRDDKGKGVTKYGKIKIQNGKVVKSVLKQGKQGKEYCIKWSEGGCSDPCPNDRIHRCCVFMSKGPCNGKHRACEHKGGGKGGKGGKGKGK